ncbi:MAG TPA: acyl-CoA dehydrogenase family protein [Stellaceae bacterium]|jgi:3-hydroxy-9,10-secoandrosta-1,3,5(10)-triene-9,17-dione monooxygenase
MTAAKLADLVTRARLLAPVLRQRAAATEKLRRLPDETIADLQETELFRLFQPVRYGGIEAPFRAFIDVGATLGRGCGSTSWVYNNLVVHNWMLGYWPLRAQDEIWKADPRALIGSSFVFPAGRAEAVEGGYRLSGKWPFSSGIDASAWMMLAAPVSNRNSEPRFFLVPRGEYSEIDNWHAMGLAGTGSKDVVADNVFVPEHRTLAAAAGKGAPHPGSAVNPGALYKLAWYALFGFVNGATALGIAQGAIEEFASATRARVATATGRQVADFATMQIRVAEAATLIDAAETLMLKDCEEAMRFAEAGKLAAMEEKTRWRRDAAFAVRMSVKAIDMLFAGAGGAAIIETHPLQRSLRDAHAAQGHIGLNWDANGTMFGRVALGLDADFPLL